MSDYPAAHSMDTEWFAVDEHGNVGRFDSGEDGAVPVDAATGWGPSDGTLDLCAVGAARLAHLLANGKDPIGALKPAPRAGHTIVAIDPVDSYRGTADEAAGARDLLDGGEFVRIGRQLPVVLLSTSDLSHARAEELAARPGVRWVLWAGELAELLEGTEGDDGLYNFNHSHGDDPGLYNRTSTPERSLAIDDFPEPERTKIAALSLRVDFAEGDIHLADLIDPSRAETWGDLPLRYTEEWEERQREATAQREAAQIARRRRLMFAVLAVAAAVIIALLVRALLIVFAVLPAIGGLGGPD
jgi:hypothetical protein